jgi:flagellar M-ring protein FliF
MSATAESLPIHVQPNNNLRPFLLLVGVALAVAAGVAIALWSKEPSYGLLVSKVSNSQAAQIVQTLEASGIEHRVEAGSVLVPTERLSEARLKIAAQGIGEDTGGFQDMQKDPGFGVSQFMETARYQHALETELAHTIANLQPIEGARVHLALPRQSAFIRDRRLASASVFVQLKAGRRLADEQVNSIVNLVASSVPEMEVSQVTVVDQQGRLLSAPHGNDEYAMRDKQYEFAHRLEELYTTRVEQLLSALVGAGRVRAQVVADVELAISEEAREQFKPESQVVRSEQQSEENSRNGSGPQGVPGALTNQPPQGGTALPPNAAATTQANGQANGQASAQAASTTDNSSSKQSTRNYEIDRTLAYTKQPPGTLKRLSVAVLVDNTRTVGDDGEEKQTPLTSEQIANMTRLVKDAVGFDEKRGDSVNVINASFAAVPEIPQDEVQVVPLWERPMIRDLAKMGGGVIVLALLVLFVLRPLTRGLMPHSSGGRALISGDSIAIQGGGGGGPTGATPNLKKDPAYDQQLTDARAIVQQDPARAAQIVKGWVASDE